MNSSAAQLATAHRLVPQVEYEDAHLSPLELTVGPNSLVCLIGPDGAGKTRYLRTLAGIELPESGELHLLGADIETMSQSEWHAMRKRIGFVAANAPLISFYSAWRNLLFPAEYHNLGSLEEIEKKANRLIAQIGIDSDLDQLPAYLGRKETHKLAIVRALMLEPEILFLDEPFKPLDAMEGAKLKEFLLSLRQTGHLALVMATHDIPFAVREADTIFFVSNENLYRFSSGRELSASPIFEVRQFLETHNRWQPHEETR